jgi:type IV pilus assembly protein PilF
MPGIERSRSASEALRAPQASMNRHRDRHLLTPAPGSIVRRVLGLALPAAVALTTLAGCFGSSSNKPAGDPVAMSRSEYDMAGDLWLRQGRRREALEHALEAVKFDDENYEAAHLVALIYLDFCRETPDDCRLENAEQYARRALEIEPDFREAKNTLGVVLIHQKRYQDAIGVLKPLTADILYQTPENAWGNLGWAYLESGQLKRAIDALRRSVAAQPLFCVGNYRLGVAYERNGQPRRALEALSRAIETDDPRCKRLQVAFAARARVRMELGDLEAAREDLEQCCKMAKSTDAGKECRSMLRKLK